MHKSVFVLALAACGSTHGGGPGDQGVDASGSSIVDAEPGDGGATDAAVDAPTPPAIQVLRGVDRASAFALSEAKTLANSHGVQWTGVYIGGPCSAGSGWTKSVVSSLASNVGWVFMPIFVGQQTSSICGADTLTAAQGTSDGEAAAAKMASFGWDAHQNIPVCLDLEAGSYGANPSGSLAYAKAWRDAVRSAGYLAYLYSNPTAINALYDGNVKFDGAWPASWFYTNFASVSPSDLDQLGTRYTNENRAWQYAGSFAVSGAGDVDGDSSDLLLAPAPGGTNL
ncbi:MAG TPA: glycoside hydrolase domain-containing protein [Kofleriaceae bacterium]|nr:glycoside hydrolase domain-containing protein [Kofleriaceae bacterium]